MMTMKSIRMRRFLLLVGFLCLTMGANAWQDPDSRLYFEWISESGKTARVIKAPNDAPYSGAYTIPEKIKNPNNPDEQDVEVKQIISEAFRGATNLTEVTIYANITNLRSGTFQESGLTSIVLPPSLETIEEKAFYSTKNLTTISLPENVTVIGNGAFQNSELVSITLPASLETIGANAFNESKLTEITIPGNVTSIGGSAFNGCSKLKSANFASIEALCGISFDGNTSNPLYYAHDLYINGSKIDDQLTIPASVTTIPAYAFQNCTSLTAVTILEEQEGEVLNGVTTIGTNAFAGCNSLESVTIPSTVTTIGSNAFKITNSTVAEENRKVSFASPESLNTIDFKDLASNPLLFAQHLYIGNSMEETLTVTLPSVKNINPRIFAGARFISQVTIPESVEYIGDDAFYLCNSISTVIFKGGEKQLKGMKYGEGQANPLSRGATPVIQGMALGSLSFTDDIEDNSFTNAKWLTEITIGPGVTSIGKNAFKGCVNLKTIIIEDNSTLNSIGEEAFYGCGALKSIDLPSSVTSIGKLAFRDTKLASINIPENCINLGISIFENCTELYTAEFALSANLTTLPNYIFKGCLNLTNITIPEKIETIGEGAFSGCLCILAPPISDYLTTIGNNAFAGCSHMKEIALTGKGKLEEIGEGAFSGCKEVSTVSLPSTIRHIMKNAFNGCSSLVHLYIYQENPDLIIVHEQAFDSQKSKITIHVENDEARLAYQASNTWKDFKEILTKRNITLRFYFNDDPIDPLTGQSFELTGEEGKPIDDTETLDYLTQLPLRDDLGDYKSFDGWYAYNKSGVISYYDLPSSAMPSEDIIFYGYYSKEIIEDEVVYLLQPKRHGTNLESTYSGYAIITGNHFTQSSENKVIPETLLIDEKKWIVSNIESSAFEGTDIYTIHLPNTIKEIEEATFRNCRNLQSINIPDALETIKWNAFEGCTALTTITIPTTVTGILDKAFCNSGLIEITIPASVSQMGNEVFKDCKDLESAVFAEGFKLPIPKYTFWNCTKLTNVTLRNTMRTIGLNAFQNCSSLKNIDFLPDGISTISNYAFSGCSGISSITLPKNISNIGSKAFSGCSKLTNITVNTEENAPSAAKDAFDNNTYEQASLFVKEELKSTFQDDQTWGQFNLFYEKVPKQLTYKINGELYKQIPITAGSPIVPINAESIIMEDKYKDRNIDDFSGWKDLPMIMPCEDKTVEGKFKYEIRYYENEVNEDNRLLGDKSYTYYWGDEVTLPVNELKRDKQRYDIIGLTQNPMDEDDAATFQMTMPAEDLNVVVKYKLAEQEDTINNIIYKVFLLEDRAEVIGNTITSKTSVVIPKQIEYDGENYKVTAIQDNAFANNKLIIGMTLPSTIESIGVKAFYDNKFETITIPAKVDKIGNEAFHQCTSLQTVNFESDENIKTLPFNLFRNCMALENITIPTSVTKIEKSVFSGCSNLKSITIKSTELPTADESSFDDPNHYDNVQLKVPETVTNLSDKPWTKFHFKLKGEESVENQCKTPTISYNKGKLEFHCDDDEAEIVSKVVCSDATNVTTDNPVTLFKIYTITAYARKDGMSNSDKVVATITWRNGKPLFSDNITVIALDDPVDILKGDVDGNGVVDTQDAIQVVRIYLGKE